MMLIDFGTFNIFQPFPVENLKETVPASNCFPIKAARSALGLIGLDGEIEIEKPNRLVEQKCHKNHINYPNTFIENVILYKVVPSTKILHLRCNGVLLFMIFYVCVCVFFFLQKNSNGKRTSVLGEETNEWDTLAVAPPGFWLVITRMTWKTCVG